MRKTAFVCFGTDGGQDSLVYHELPRKRGGEEFFVFISPGNAKQEQLLRRLYRDSISASRLGHPAQYFFQLMEQFKEMATGIDAAEELLQGSQLVIMIRRGDEFYLFHKQDSVVQHWDGGTGRVGTIESIHGVREIPLKEMREQGDLFEQHPENLFVLWHFPMPGGAHTLVVTPSNEFLGRYHETLRNSIYFPSFEIPEDLDISLDTSHTFPAIHWNTASSVVKETADLRFSSLFKRISIPVIVGGATLTVALFLLFGPLNKEEAGREPDVLLAVEDEEPAELRPSEHLEALEEKTVKTISLAEAWKKGFDAPVTSSPVYYKDTVFFGCRDGSLYAFTTEGKLKWRYESGDGIGASPLCISNRVVGANYAGNVFCLNVEDGEKVWTFSARARIVSKPQAWKDLVLVGTIEGNLIALKMKDGTRLWSEKVGDGIWADIVLGDGYIVTATTDGSLIRMDHKGKIIWRVKPGGGIHSSPLCLEEEKLVVFGTKDKYIYAYSLSNGDLMWRHLTNGEVNSQPVFSGKTILVGSEDARIYALTVNGQLLWRAKLGGPVRSRPLVIDRVVFVTTYGSELVAIDLHSGELKERFRASSPIYSSPDHDEKKIYFGSNGGIFYAIWIYGGVS